MDSQHDNSGLAATYADSVEHERQAWQALQSFPPGSIGRSRAWETWSRSIMLTNQAWRRLSADRLTHAGPHGPLAPARPHAGP